MRQTKSLDPLLSIYKCAQKKFGFPFILFKRPKSMYLYIIRRENMEYVPNIVQI